MSSCLATTNIVTLQYEHANYNQHYKILVKNFAHFHRSLRCHYTPIARITSILITNNGSLTPRQDHIGLTVPWPNPTT